MKSLENKRHKAFIENNDKRPGNSQDIDQPGSLAYQLSQELVDKHYTSPDSGWHERREQEPKTVVRVFLYQAISPDRIPDNADPRDLDFVRMILLKKGPGNSENQIMPVGGNVDDGETVDEAIIREAVEETHLRAIPNSIVPFRTIQEYAFDHQTEERPKKTHKHRRTYYFQGHLLPEPHDQPYVLDPEEDKIANFEHLTVAQVERMFRSGEITTEHGTGYMQDALNPNEDTRANYNVEADNADILAVQREALLRMRLGEAEKKMQILLELQTQYQSERRIDTDDYLHAVHLAQSIDESIYDKMFTQDAVAHVEEFIVQVDLLWKHTIDQYGFTTEDIKRALSNVNNRYTLNHAAEHFEEETGKGIPTANFIFPLLLGKKFSIGNMRLLMENPQTKKLLTLTQALANYHLMSSDPDPKMRAARERNLRRTLGVDDGVAITTKNIKAWMYKEGYLDTQNPQSLTQLSNEVDSYFETLQREAKITELNIDQANEVKGVSFDKLLAAAFATGDQVRGETAKEQAIIQWEARRKLLLMMMLHDAKSFSADVFERGIDDIDDIERALESADSLPDKRKLALQINGNNVDVAVKIERRVKSDLSLLRKLIVRDKVATGEELAGDIFAEAIIFNDEAADDTIHTFDAPCRVEDAKGRKLEQFDAPVVVGAYIEALVREAAAQGKTIEITKFKGLPKIGEQFESSGPGGGAPVRMCKFYIRYTKPNGEVQQREVQMFVPNLTKDGWVPGQVDYDAKKKDDEDYAVRRLFSTKAVRSFMELLYPAEVYGDSIQPVYKSRVG